MWTSHVGCDGPLLPCGRLIGDIADQTGDFANLLGATRQMIGDDVSA